MTNYLNSPRLPEAEESRLEALLERSDRQVFVLDVGLTEPRDVRVDSRELPLQVAELECDWIEFGDSGRRVAGPVTVVFAAVDRAASETFAA